MDRKSGWGGRLDFLGCSCRSCSKPDCVHDYWWIFSSSLYFLAIFKHSLVSIPSVFYRGALDSNKSSTSVWVGSPHDWPARKRLGNLFDRKNISLLLWRKHELKFLFPFLQLHWTFQITYKLSIALNKASILLLFIRIMPQRFYRLSCWALFILVSVFAVSTIIASVFQCVPVEKAWHKNKSGYCYPLVNAWYANAIFSIVTDCLILALPMWMVYQMQRDMREKVLLFMVFGLGIL